MLADADAVQAPPGQRSIGSESRRYTRRVAPWNLANSEVLVQCVNVGTTGTDSKQNVTVLKGPAKDAEII
jgi:hypothetical protein